MSDLFKVADMDGKGLGCRRSSRSPIWSILSQSRLVEGAQTNVVPIYGAALAGLVSAQCLSNGKYFVEFKKECETFLKVGQHVCSKFFQPRGKIAICDEWKERRKDIDENFSNFA